jgi:hypothetical protein
VSETVYKFREGSRFRGDAGAVAVELERIRAEQGALKSEAVVTEAEADVSPLHPFFEWDDSAAAHAHRLMQARMLIRAVEVVRGDRPPVSMYVHYSMPEATDGAYEPLAVVAAQPDRYLSALAEAQKDVAAAQRRVTELLAVARTTGTKKGEVARIMLAVQALQTANEAIHALN